MSFLSDAFEGNWSNLGTDIVDAPSSFANHPQEWGEVGAAALAALSLGTLAPEAFALEGATEAGVAAADIGAGAGLATDLGIADIGAGLGEAGLATDLGIADIGAGLGAGFDIGGLSPNALAFLPGEDIGSALGFAPEFAGGGDFGTNLESIAPFSDMAPGEAQSFAPTFAQTDAELSGGLTGTAPVAAEAGAGATSTGAGATTTPAGFAPTDAELSGAATGTGPAAPGGSGFNSLIQGAGGWGNILKYGTAVAPLALTLGMGQAQLPSSAQQLQGQAAALSQQGQSDLTAARAGQLNAGQTAVIGQARQNAENKWRQLLYNQGVTDVSKDSRWPQIEQQIDAEVTAQTAQLLQQNITNALAETGQAATALTSIAQMQMASDTAFTNNLIRATAALGGAFGNSGNTITVKAA